MALWTRPYTFVDGTSIRAHQHAAGAKGGKTSKRPAEVEVAFPRKFICALTGPDVRLPIRSRRDSKMQQVAINTPGRCHPRQLPQRVCADKGYSSRAIRACLRRQGIGVVIPHKRTERHRGPFAHACYRERARIEQCFNRLKQFRRIATRYEK